MKTHLHLLSTPGERDIRYVLAALNDIRAVQPGSSGPLKVAYVPWASTVDGFWLNYTRRAFDGLAKVVFLHPDHTSPAQAKAVFSDVTAVYISGGNTFLLNDRLHTSGVFDVLLEGVLDGLPVIGFSAGAILCGPNILTSHDINLPPTTHFTALGALPHNILPHYPTEPNAQADADDWLGDYFVRHTNPVLALSDGARAVWQNERLLIKAGPAWVITPENKQILEIVGE